jgi:hypothetical protein
MCDVVCQMDSRIRYQCVHDSASLLYFNRHCCCDGVFLLPLRSCIALLLQQDGCVLFLVYDSLLRMTRVHQAPNSGLFLAINGP